MNFLNISLYLSSLCHVVWSPVYVQFLSHGLATILRLLCVTLSDHQSMSRLCHVVRSPVYTSMSSSLVTSIRPASVTWSGHEFTSNLRYLIWSPVNVQVMSSGLVTSLHLYVELISQSLVASLCSACITWSSNQSMSSLCHMALSPVYVQLVSRGHQSISSLCHMVWKRV